MSTLSVHASRGLGSPAPASRFASAAEDDSVRWHMKRNCSFAPHQLLNVYLSLCLVGLAIGAAFWIQGAPYVLPFAGAELLAVGAALVLYSRHAADQENLVLAPGRLSVACTLGRRTERVEFAAPAWVRVEPAHRDGSLIELSGEGRRIAVGRFVRPELRPALADELRAALRRTTGAATA
ncbi:MAG: DUF2244 domain-containing protein [Burkholderiales bacterium]|nr:DUF2244 domain-containing protein [Burkholderiales bacterium]